MNESIKKYKVVNLKSPMVLFVLFLFFVYVSASIWFTVMLETWWMFLISFIMTTLYIFLLYHAKTSEIIFTKSEVIKKTPFRIKKLKYNSIKSFGAYSSSGYFNFKIDEKDINKREYFGQKFGYVSSIMNYNPNGFKQKGSIRFHLTDEIYNVLNQKIKAAANTSYTKCGVLN